ncbi:hypothetical protein CEXT_658791 [Caerostris extrusa]|uniref:Uncharacterized protein n=1 Tax=Caerostris extrusa TaxID=172846 RepID=A0AAV4WFM6_CAEEX|nr:hypothetical protein CEXT_658791 [Caerostris extrusa]
MWFQLDGVPAHFSKKKCEVSGTFYLEIDEVVEMILSLRPDYRRISRFRISFLGKMTPFAKKWCFYVLVRKSPFTFPCFSSDHAFKETHTKKVFL